MFGTTGDNIRFDFGTKPFGVIGTKGEVGIGEFPKGVLSNLGKVIIESLIINDLISNIDFIAINNLIIESTLIQDSINLPDQNQLQVIPISQNFGFSLDQDNYLLSGDLSVTVGNKTFTKNNYKFILSVSY